MMTPERQVKILDLGVGLVFPLQMVEEQPDKRSDVFNLGAVFYELLTGHRPFSSSSAPGVNEATTLAPPPAIADFREDASQALNEVVTKALAKDPETRYQTMGALAHDLRNLFAAELARDPKRVALAHDSRGARKPGAAEGEELPPGSLMDDLKNALHGLLESKPKRRAASVWPLS